MTRQDIINEITSKIVPMDFDVWRIGLTHEPQERKTHWKEIQKRDVSCWTAWQADSLVDAKVIETYFVTVKGMKGVTNGADLSLSKTIFAYIF
jgi:hypothetical protein